MTIRSPVILAHKMEITSQSDTEHLHYGDEARYTA